MKWLIYLMVCAVSLGCAQTSAWLSSGIIYKGYYSAGFERSSFVPVGTKERWWLTPKVAIPCEKYLGSGRLGDPIPIVYMEVRGALTQEGRYGHMGIYNRELVANAIGVCRTLLPDERITQ